MHAAQKAIQEALADLAEKLDELEQTSHGKAGPFTIEEVARCIARCHDEPNSFTISDLSQAIDGFLKTE